MDKPLDLRGSHRILTQLKTYYSSERQDGGGELVDISYEGALVEDTSTQPSVGAGVKLHLCLPDDPKPLQFDGKVVRHTETGFALSFDKPSADICRWIDTVTDSPEPPEESSLEENSTDSATDEPSDAPERSDEMWRLRQLDLTKCTVSDLEMLTERATAELARRRKASKQRLREELAGLAKQNGFSLEEVIEPPGEGNGKNRDTQS